MADKKVAFAEGALVIITLIWGLGFPITKIAIELGYSANVIMVARFTIASIILSIVYARKFKLIDKKYIKYGIITGVFLFLGFYFQTVGNAYTTPSKNGFITQLNIVFVPFLYYLFFRKSVDKYNVISVLVAVLGMFIMSYTNQGFGNINLGDILTFVCAIMVAFNVVAASYYQKKHDFDPALFVIVNIFTAMVFSIIFMLLFDSAPTNVIWYNLWPLVFLGVFNTALGFLVQSYALKISQPIRVSLIVSLEGVFAAIGSVLIVHEILSIQIVVGGLLIISGVLISEVKPFRIKGKHS